MPISLPDSTKFDADSDKISTSRAELKKISDAVNTLGGQWNTNGDTFGAGGFKVAELICTNNQKPRDSGGTDGVLDGDLNETVQFYFDDISDTNSLATVNLDSAGGGTDFTLESGTYFVWAGTYFTTAGTSYGTPSTGDDGPRFWLAKSGTQQIVRNHILGGETSAEFFGLITSTGSEEFTLNMAHNAAGNNLTFRQQILATGSGFPVAKILIAQVA
jgi:hypothetical protein